VLASAVLAVLALAGPATAKAAVVASAPAAAIVMLKRRSDAYIGVSSVSRWRPIPF
jgi:hypothetical protein